MKQECPCGESSCKGMEALREYASWEDLVAHCGEATIVRFVNELADKKEREVFSRQKYGAKQRAALRLMRETLGPDEMAELNRRAALTAERKMHE